MSEKRRLGRSDLEISTVTMGCWAIAGDSTWGAQDEADAIGAVRTALECGVNCLDTAEGYGSGVSEQLLRKALEGHRSETVICSKVFPQHTERWEDMVASCENSLKNLGTDYIDLYYLHWPNRKTPIEEILKGFDKLVQAGKIRHYGVSNFGVGDMTELLKYGRVDVNQLPYNLLWRAIEYEVLPLCKEQEVGVACYSPLMHGLLTGKFKDSASVPDCRARTRHFSSAHKQIRHHEAGQDEATFQAIDEIRGIATEVGCPMAELALAWLIQRPGVSTVIAGARSPEQMKANAKAMERTLSQDVMDRLDKATASLKAAFGPNPDMWQSGSDTRYR